MTHFFKRPSKLRFAFCQLREGLMLASQRVQRPETHFHKDLGVSCVWLCACEGLCTHTRKARTRANVCANACVHTHLCEHVHACLCVHVRECTHMWGCEVFVCTCKSVHAPVHVHTHVNVCVWDAIKFLQRKQPLVLKSNALQEHLWRAHPLKKEEGVSRLSRSSVWESVCFLWHFYSTMARNGSGERPVA